MIVTHSQPLFPVIFRLSRVKNALKIGQHSHLTLPILLTFFASLSFKFLAKTSVVLLITAPILQGVPYPGTSLKKLKT